MATLKTRGTQVRPKDARTVRFRRTKHFRRQNVRHSSMTTSRPVGMPIMCLDHVANYHGLQEWPHDVTTAD